MNACDVFKAAAQRSHRVAESRSRLRTECSCFGAAGSRQVSAENRCDREQSAVLRGGIGDCRAARCP